MISLFGAPMSTIIELLSKEHYYTIKNVNIMHSYKPRTLRAVILFIAHNINVYLDLTKAVV